MFKRSRVPRGPSEIIFHKTFIQEEWYISELQPTDASNATALALLIEPKNYFAIQCCGFEDSWGCGELQSGAEGLLGDCRDAPDVVYKRQMR